MDSLACAENLRSKIQAFARFVIATALLQSLMFDELFSRSDITVGGVNLEGNALRGLHLQTYVFAQTWGGY